MGSNAFCILSQKKKKIHQNNLKSFVVLILANLNFFALCNQKECILIYMFGPNSGIIHYFILGCIKLSHVMFKMTT